MWKKETHYDVSKTTELLGRPLTPPMQTCREMAASLIELGIAKRKPELGIAKREM